MLFWFWTQIQCVYVEFGDASHTPPNNSPTPAACPKIQLSSDSIYQRGHWIPQVEGSILQDCSPHHHVRCHVLTYASDQL